MANIGEVVWEYIEGIYPDEKVPPTLFYIQKSTKESWSGKCIISAICHFLVNLSRIIVSVLTYKGSSVWAYSRVGA